VLETSVYQGRVRRGGLGRLFQFILFYGSANHRSGRCWNGIWKQRDGNRRRSKASECECSVLQDVSSSMACGEVQPSLSCGVVQCLEPCAVRQSRYQFHIAYLRRDEQHGSERSCRTVGDKIHVLTPWVVNSKIVLLKFASLIGSRNRGSAILRLGLTELLTIGFVLVRSSLGRF